VAPRDVPPFARASMDGYAVVAHDTFGASRAEPKTLTILERLYTGEVARSAVSSGACIEIATGAPLPDGADAVVQVEETEPAGADMVRILTPVYPKQNVARQGADITSGQRVLGAGEVLSPSRIGALAALGFGEVEVYRKPAVAVLSTGNEIVEPGHELQPGQVYDINRYTLAAIVAQHGGRPIPFATARDTIEALDEAVTACLTCDLIVFSGGSSVGDRDLILDLIGRRGTVLFHGIALKPGKPTALALVEGKPFFGMPGYPTSCLSNAYVLLVPALRAMARLPEAPPRTITLPLSLRIVSSTGRYQIYTVRIVNGEAVPAFKASGDITSMSQADGYIEIPQQTDVVEKGTMVDVKLFQ
jgi:molybdenum cofactor synthesis domain-containing protein